MMSARTNFLPVLIRGAVAMLSAAALCDCASNPARHPATNTPGLARVPMEVRNGVPLIPCRINDRGPVWMILDSGSQAIVLERDTAQRCGITPAASGSLAMAGTSGAEMGSAAVAPSIRIAGRTWMHQPCLVRTQRTLMTGTALLGARRITLDIAGMSLFRDSCSWISLDFRRHCAEFEFGSDRDFPAPATATAVPLEFHHGLPFITLNAHGLSWRALLDTGCSAALEINADLARRLSLQNAASSPGILRAGVGRNSAATPIKAMKLDALAGLGAPRDNVDVLVVDDLSKVGCGLLRAHRVTLDFRRSVLWIE